MADIASLGFAIDTGQLTRANAELRRFASNAGTAERAADRFGAAANNAGTRAAAAMSRAANAAQGAAVAINAGATASAAAATRAAAAQNAAAAATRAAAVATNAASAANNNHTQTATRAASANNSLGLSFMGLNASTILSTAAIITAGQAVMRAMDAYTQLQNTLKIAGLAGNEMAAVQARLFESANRNGVAIEDVTQFYRRMSITQKEVGAGNLDMVKMVDAVTAALRVQGTTSKAASGALLQLSQSFGSGRVKAEEFNSIQEGALPLLQAAANGITRFGGSISKLRAEVIAGTVTSKEFFEGILRGGNDLEQLAATTKLTLAGALTAAHNSFINLIGQMDKAGAVGDSLTTALKEVSKWMDTLAKDPEFLDGVKSAFDQLRAVIEATKKEIQMILYLIKLGKSAAEFLSAEVSKTNAAFSVKELTEAERIIGMLEDIKKSTENKLSSTKIPQAIEEYNRQLSITNEKLSEQIAIRDRLRGRLTHSGPDPFGPMNGNPWDSDVGESTSPFASITNKRTAGASPGAKKGGNSIEDAYKKIQTNAAQLVATLKLQEQQLGRTEEETNRLTYAMDLENKVIDAKIPLTKSVTEWIAKMADAQAKAKTSLDVSTLIHNNTEATKEYVRQQEIEYETIGMSREAATAYRIEQQTLAKVLRDGKTLSDEQRGTLKANALAHAAAEEKVKAYSEALEFAKDIAKGFFSDMREGLINGQSLWESFGTAAINVLNRIADKLVNMAIDGLFAEAFGGGRSSVGGAGGGSFGGMFSGLSSGWNEFAGWAGLGPQSADSLMGLTSSGIFGSGISGGSALGALGGLASAGMGFAQGGTAGTISGIAGLVGAGASFIPGIGPFLGPAISMLGSILPGLFGSSEPPKPPVVSATGELRWGASGSSSSGYEMNGAESLTKMMGELGDSLTALFTAAGGIADTGKLYGVGKKTWSQGQYSSNSSYIINPDGSIKQWAMNSSDAGMDQATGHAALMSLISGGVNVSSNLLQALDQFVATEEHPDVAPVSLGTITETVKEIGALDEAMKYFGRDVPEAEIALDALNKTFDEMVSIAEKYNLAASETVKIEAERTRQEMKMADDFKYVLSQGILGFDNPLQAALNDLDKSKLSDIDTNLTFLREVEGYEDQRHAIEVLYLKRRNEMIEQYNDSALNNQEEMFNALEDLIKSYLPGGNMAGESAAAHLAGLQASYTTAKASAFADPLNEQIIADFIQASSALAEFSKDFFSNDVRFVAQRDQLIADAQALQSLGGGSSTTSPTTPAATASDAQFQQLLSTVGLLTTQLTASQNEIQRLTALLDRYLANAGK